MKKVVSLVMALVMMILVCVPAFATKEINHNSAQQSNTATVQTDTSLIIGDGTYSVTYPATMNILWENTEATEFKYTVNSQLKTGKLVNVQIADAENKYEMVNTDGDVILYALGGAVNGTTVNPVAENVEFTYSITVADWSNVPIDAYEDTLTFTVSVVDA